MCICGSGSRNLCHYLVEEVFGNFLLSPHFHVHLDKGGNGDMEGFILSSYFYHQKKVWFLCLLSNAFVKHIEVAIIGLFSW